MKTPEQIKSEELQQDIKRHQQEVETFKILSLTILEHRQRLYNEMSKKINR